jgi:anthranilate/para-aminobenzoate synthase component II
MKKPILFLDFEDSFTFNVIQELELLGMNCEVIDWSDFRAGQQAGLVVLGPGPGHPDDYQRIFPELQSHLNWGGKFFGVCLGHQILWRLRGVKVERSLRPLHGQKVRLELDTNWKDWLGVSGEVWVQRYNSLAVKAPADNGDNFTQDGEILITRDLQSISYQFHPESMGTNCRDAFFRVVRRDLL